MHQHIWYLLGKTTSSTFSVSSFYNTRSTLPPGLVRPFIHCTRPWPAPQQAHVSFQQNILKTEQLFKGTDRLLARASAAKKTFKSLPSGDAIRACPLDRALVKMDILVPGKLKGTGEGKGSAAVALSLGEVLGWVFVKPPAITVFSLCKDTATGTLVQSFSLLTPGLIKRSW